MKYSRPLCLAYLACLVRSCCGFSVSDRRQRAAARFDSGAQRLRISAAAATATAAASGGDLDSAAAPAAADEALLLPTSPIGTVTFLIPHSDQDQKRPTRFGKSSPVGNPTILEAVQHLSLKCSWCADDLIDTFIVPVPLSSSSSSSSSSQQQQDMDKIRSDLMDTDVLIALGLVDEQDLEFASTLFEDRRERTEDLKQRQCQFAIDCAGNSKKFPVFCGPFDERFPDFESVFVPWTKAATGRRLAKQMKQLFQRSSTDEWVLGILIFLNQFSGSEIDWVKHNIDATWEKGPVRNIIETVQMISLCGDCITNCLKDDTCRNCLSTLTKTDTRDQVASYRAIVSFESDLLRDFSFCILQKHNVFACDASIPTLPQVTPLASFRGETLTPEVARSLLVGHLEGEEIALQGSLGNKVSWIVTLGANEAYDKFPSQNQLFYPAARGKDLWYDPVFRVKTLDGRNVWCKRHYKVRPQQKAPGTFRFSVLDNGITSDEFWTIVAVADDLSWIVFHYAGAASAVGLRYVGGLVCTPDGRLPKETDRPQIWDAVRAAGIQPWELYTCYNDVNSPGYLDAGPPPLQYFRDKVAAQRASLVEK